MSKPRPSFTPAAEDKTAPTPATAADQRKKRRETQTTIQSLDRDILCTIFAFLDMFDLVRCSVVCKFWYSPFPSFANLNETITNCHVPRRNARVRRSLIFVKECNRWVAVAARVLRQEAEEFFSYLHSEFIWIYWKAPEGDFRGIGYGAA